MVFKTPNADAKKRRAELASNIKTAVAGFLQAMRAPFEANSFEEEWEGHKAKAERTQKDLAEIVSKTPKAIQQKRRAELASNIKTAEAEFL